MIKGDIKNVKSIELIAATSGLPYNTISDVFVRVEDGFEFNSEYIYDSGATSKTNVFLNEEQVLALAENFKVVEYIDSKKDYKLKSVISRLEQATKEYEDALAEIKLERQRLNDFINYQAEEELTIYNINDKFQALKGAIKSKLEEYEAKAEELGDNWECDPLADEALTVYMNLITLLKYLDDEKYTKGVIK